MAKLYSRTNWKDYPSEETPINAQNLNNMDKGINDLDDKLNLIENNIANEKKSTILWRGGIFSGGSAEFSIPKECFHNNETTVTLVIESYMRAEDTVASVGNKVTIISLSFGNPLDFGISSGDLDGPFVNEYGYNTATVYQNVHDAVTTYAFSLLDLKISAKKVSDSRYAICLVYVEPTSDSGIVITNISAYVPADL